jgi:hypothetical protein
MNDVAELAGIVFFGACLRWSSRDVEDAGEVIVVRARVRRASEPYRPDQPVMSGRERKQAAAGSRSSAVTCAPPPWPADKPSNRAGCHREARNGRYWPSSASIVHAQETTGTAQKPSYSPAATGTATSEGRKEITRVICWSSPGRLGGANTASSVSCAHLQNAATGQDEGYARFRPRPAEGPATIRCIDCIR